MKAIALIGQVTDVQPHPDNDELRHKMDIVTIGGRINVANRPTPDTPRYKVGDYAVMLTENMILPDWLIKSLDLWDETKNKGMLGGSAGNRLKPRNMGIKTKIRSEVALYACWFERHPDRVIGDVVTQEGTLRLPIDNDPVNAILMVKAADSNKPSEMTPIGYDVANKLGIEEIYEP